MNRMLKCSLFVVKSLDAEKHYVCQYLWNGWDESEGISFSLKLI